MGPPEPFKHIHPNVMIDFTALNEKTILSLAILLYELWSTRTKESHTITHTQPCNNRYTALHDIEEESPRTVNANSQDPTIAPCRPGAGFNCVVVPAEAIAFRSVGPPMNTFLRAENRPSSNT